MGLNFRAFRVIRRNVEQRFAITIEGKWIVRHGRMVGGKHGEWASANHVRNSCSCPSSPSILFCLVWFPLAVILSVFSSLSSPLYFPAFPPPFSPPPSSPVLDARLRVCVCMYEWVHYYNPLQILITFRYSQPKNRLIQILMPVEV